MTPTPLILDSSEFLARSGDPQVLPVGVVTAQSFERCRIPGSALVQPGELVSGIPPATGKLPSLGKLEALVQRLGLTADRHVIAWDDEGGGWAGRLIWTLDVLGHGRASYLDGGLVAWAAAGLATESGATTRSQHTAEGEPRPLAIHPGPRATLAELRAQLDDPGTVVWDARSPEEYRGERITAMRNGHIPGAVNLDWLELMDQRRHLRLKSLETLRDLLAHRGIAADMNIITHCQTHHRSGLSYLVGKALGLAIRAYDGSWSEWGNRPDTPVEK